MDFRDYFRQQIGVAQEGAPEIGPAQRAAPKTEARWQDLFSDGEKLRPEWKQRANQRVNTQKGPGEMAFIPKPFAGTGLRLNDQLRMQSIAAKMDLKKATPEEVEEFYDNFIDENLRDGTFWGKVAALGSGSLEFAGEIGIGSMVGQPLAGGAARAVASKMIAKGASEATAKFMSKALTRAASMGVTVSAQEALPRILPGVNSPGGAWTANMIDVALGDGEYTDEQKQRMADDMNAVVQVAYEKGGDLLQGLALSTVEVVSESTGGALGKAVPPAAYMDALFGAAMRKLAGRVPANKMGAALKQALQWDGPFRESLEEVVAEVGKAALVEGKTVPEAIEEWTGNLPVMLTTFAIPGVAGAAAQRTSDAVRLASGGQVAGRKDVGDGDGTAGPVEPQPSAGPSTPPLSPQSRAQALKNYSTAAREEIGEEAEGAEVEEFDEIGPRTVSQVLAAKVFESSGVPHIPIRGKGEKGTPTRGYFDPETGAAVWDVEDPNTLRTAYHEVAHAKWAKWSDQKRKEFVSAVSAVDPEFLKLAQSSWLEDTGFEEKDFAPGVMENEGQAVGAETLAPIVQFLGTERGQTIAAKAEEAKPGSMRRLYEFGADFLRAFAGYAPKAPTTALKALQKGLGAKVQVSDVKLAKLYKAAFEESVAAAGSPATMADVAGADVFTDVASSPLGKSMGVAEAEEQKPEDKGKPKKKREKKVKPNKRERKQQAKAEAEKRAAEPKAEPKVEKTAEDEEREFYEAAEREYAQAEIDEKYAAEPVMRKLGLFARHASSAEVKESQQRYDGKLMTRRGREQIADQLEGFLKRLYFGKTPPSEWKTYLEALRGRGTNQMLSEQVQDARMRLAKQQPEVAPMKHLFARKGAIHKTPDGRWEVVVGDNRAVRVNKGAAERTLETMQSSAKVIPLLTPDLEARIMAADVVPSVERKKRKVSRPHLVVISDKERKIIAKAGDDAPLVEKTWREYVAQHPVTAGWAPIQLAKFEISEDRKGDKTVKVEAKTVPYGIAQNPETGKAYSTGKKTREVRNEAVRNTGGKIVREMRKIVARADAGDPHAMVILRNAGWYSNMVEVLRNVFGGSADLFVDLLGATSPNTPVQTNWRFAVDFIQRMSQGHFDDAIEAFAAHLSSGGRRKEFEKANEALVPTQASGKRYGFNSMNALRASLLGLWRIKNPSAAPKAKNFSWNLTQFSDDATIDVWAARFIARVMGRTRVPSAAEGGVGGAWDSKANYITGEFGFAQEAMQVAADRMGMRAKDLQAVLWFAEKEHWTENGWTSTQGEAGSFEVEDADGQLGRLISGVSMQKSDETQGTTFVPTAEEKREQISPLVSQLNADPNVMSTRAGNTIGRYYAENGEAIEKSFDLEVIAGPDFDVNVLEREIKRIAKQYKQDSAFISRVIRHDEELPADARPALEIYFNTPLAPDRVQPFIAAIRAKGLDGFTLIRADQPNQSRSELLEDPYAFVGIRLQAIHEFYTPSEFERPDGTKDVVGYHRQWEDAARDLERELSVREEVSYIGTQYVRTIVFFKDSYDDTSGQTSRAALARGGQSRSRLTGRGAPASPDSGVRDDGAERGDPRLVPSGDGKSALFARRRGGRNKLPVFRFDDALGLNSIAEAAAWSARSSASPRAATAAPAAASSIERDPNLGLSEAEGEVIAEAQKMAARQGDTTQTGRPGLNNPGQTKQSRAVIRAVDEERRALMDVRPLEMVHEEARQNLAEGGQERRQAIERLLAAGSQLTDTETVEAVLIGEELVSKWVKSQRQQDFLNSTLWYQALRAVRTAAARAQGATRNMGMSAEATFAEALVAPTRSQERRLRALRRRMAAVIRRTAGAGTSTSSPVKQLGSLFARSPKATAAAKRVSIQGFDRNTGRMVSPAVYANLQAQEAKIHAEILASAQRGLTAVQAAGYTVAQMNQLWLDPVAGRPLRATFGAAKAGWSEKAFEYRYMSILSGIRTHVKNISGNTVNFGIEGFLQPLVEGMINTVVRNPNAPAGLEAFTFTRGAARAMKAAVSNAWLAWRGDIPVLEVQMHKAGVNIGAYTSRADAIEADRLAPATNNALANVLRKMSLSMLLAMDEFFKTLAVHGQSLALATRIAKNEGLSGAARESRIQALLSDASHPLWAEAIDKARKITFQDEGGAISQAVERAGYTVRTALDTATPYFFLGTTLIPFIGTPVRIMANVLRRSPLEVGLFATRILTGKYRSKPHELVQDAADAAIATVIAATVWALMDDDEDGLPRVTGSRPANRGEAEMMTRLGIPPMSIRIGNQWFLYRDVEPLSTSLGIMADGVDEFKRTGTLGAMQAVLASAMNLAKDKTFVRTLGELYDLTQTQTNAQGRVADMISFSFITPWVPNAIRQPLRALDDSVRGRVRQQEGENIFVTTSKDLPYQLLPVKELAPAPRFDLWGRPILKEASQSPSNPLVRLLAPVIPQGIKGEQLQADVFMKAYNDAARAGEFGDERPSYPLLPSYTFEFRGEVHRWTDDEYAELTQRSGESAANAVARLVKSGALSIEHPRVQQMDLVKTLISNARKPIVAELKTRRLKQGTEMLPVP